MSEAAKIRTKYAGAVPCLCSRHAATGGVAASPKSKYLIRGASRAGELLDALRQDIGLEATAALHLYLPGDAPIAPDTTLSELDAAHAGADGFLHVSYSALSAEELPAARPVPS